VVEPYPSEKYEFVSWDDEIPNWMENIIHVPNHQLEFLDMVLITRMVNNSDDEHDI
jgi:hypothetical protein